jgi:predicted MPP superfamily phosphohydrolase
VRFPGRETQFYPPLGEKYPQGFYQVGDMTLYTNRGVGMSDVKIRLRSRPEVAMFVLASDR